MDAVRQNMQIVEEGENRDEMRDGNQWFAAATPEKENRQSWKKKKRINRQTEEEKGSKEYQVNKKHRYTVKQGLGEKITVKWNFEIMYSNNFKLCFCLTTVMRFDYDASLGVLVILWHPLMWLLSSVGYFDGCGCEDVNDFDDITVNTT